MQVTAGQVSSSVASGSVALLDPVYTTILYCPVSLGIMDPPLHLILAMDQSALERHFVAVLHVA